MGVRERTARALLRQVTAARSSLQQAPSLAAGAVTVAPSSSPAVAAPPARGLAALARPPPLPGSLLSAALPSAGCGTAAWLELRLGQPRRGLAHKGKGKGKGGAAAVADTSGAEAAEFDVGELEAEVDKCVDHFQHELSNLRSGRATAEMLDFVQVEVYGEKSPLKAAAAVSVRGPQLLALSVYDPGAVPAVVKAIRESPLGLEPRQEGKGQEVLVPVPPPTAETVKALEKLVAKAAEAAKVSVRHARHKAMEAAKRAFASKDDQKRAEKEVQAAVDAAVGSIADITKHKLKSFHQ